MPSYIFHLFLLLASRGAAAQHISSLMRPSLLLAERGSSIDTTETPPHTSVTPPHTTETPPYTTETPPHTTKTPPRTTETPTPHTAETLEWESDQETNWSSSSNSTSQGGDGAAMMEITTSTMKAASGAAMKRPGLIDKETKDLVLEIVNCYLIPIVCPFGLAGNVLSLVALLCIHKGGNSTTVLLVALTFSDLGYLLTTLMRKLSCVASKIDPERGWWLNIIFLPQVYMLNRVFNHVTTFTTMVISIERFLAVFMPFKVGLIITKNRMIATAVAVYVISFALQAPFFFIYEVYWKTSEDGRRFPSYRTTSFYRDNDDGIIVYNNVVLSNVLVVGPMVVVCFCTVMVLRKITSSARFRQRASSAFSSGKQSKERSKKTSSATGDVKSSVSNSTDKSSSQTEGNVNDGEGNSTTASNAAPRTTGNAKEAPPSTGDGKDTSTATKKEKPQLKGDNRKLTTMLTTIAVIYVVCNLPTAVTNLTNYLEPEFSSFGGRYTNIFLAISGCNILLLCVNSSVNFLIYIATSSTIGNSFRRLLPACFRRKSVTAGQKTK